MWCFHADIEYQMTQRFACNWNIASLVREQKWLRNVRTVETQDRLPMITFGPAAFWTALADMQRTSLFAGSESTGQIMSLKTFARLVIPKDLARSIPTSAGYTMSIFIISMISTQR